MICNEDDALSWIANGGRKAGVSAMSSAQRLRTGFYGTQDIALAREWACKRPGRSGYCNRYVLDLSGLAVLDLDSDDFSVHNWLAVLFENRVFDWDAGYKDRFIARYRVDLSGADVVCGYRADDSYFGIARAFLTGSLTDMQASQLLKLGDLGRQVVVRSERAFEALHFATADLCKADEWYPRWSKRDVDARQAFRDVLAHDADEKGDAVGKRVFDLV